VQDVDDRSRQGENVCVIMALCAHAEAAQKNGRMLRATW
jgi:hypothetical protein